MLEGGGGVEEAVRSCPTPEFSPSKCFNKLIKCIDFRLNNFIIYLISYYYY